VPLQPITDDALLQTDNRQAQSDFQPGTLPDLRYDEKPPPGGPCPRLESERKDRFDLITGL